MEGPSIVIVREELEPFFGRRVLAAKGSLKEFPFRSLESSVFQRARSWGKHLLLIFDTLQIRIHFLMWGSYRINSRRKDRNPRLSLQFENGEVNFYNCSVRILEHDVAEIYDWSADIMSKKWDPKKALRKLRSSPKNALICDLLMDQNTFAGVGNIIKNEVLFRLKIHPETKLGKLSLSQLRAIVKQTRTYSLQFYRWKKIFQLKRHWKIFRKSLCPICGAKVTHKLTGAGERISHYCESCQRKQEGKGRRSTG